VNRVLHKFGRLLSLLALFALALPAHPSMAASSGNGCDAGTGFGDLAITMEMPAAHHGHQKATGAEDCCDLLAMDTCTVQNSSCCTGLAGTISVGEPIHAPIAASASTDTLSSAPMGNALSAEPPPPRL